MVTFAVDDVAPAQDLLATQALSAMYPDTIAIGGDPGREVIAPNGVHPLLSAVSRAFAEHRPLVLSPDAVWLTITQGLAQHVRLHAEELRPNLVSHHGRRPLTIRVEGPEEWPDLIEHFGKLVAHEADGSDLFMCDFTTSTTVERIASQIVLMDAYSPYFSFWLVAVCGIPTITLTGTVEDWQEIQRRVERLEPFGVDLWQRSLRPIAEQFVRAASNDIDTDFWKRIYSPRDAYGGEVVTGWITRLYPYLEDAGVQGFPNPMLELPIDEPKNQTLEPNDRYGGPGVRTDSVPATVSSAKVNVVGGPPTSPNRVTLHGGLLATVQHDSRALEPIAGWYLTAGHAQIDDVIDRILAEHVTTAPEDVRWPEGPGEVIELYRRLGSASLLDGAWRIPPRNDRDRIYRSGGLRSIDALVEVTPGRWLSAVSDYKGAVDWVTCRIERTPNEPTPGRLPLIRDWNSKLLDDPSEIPTFGNSLALILEAALENQGDISHLQTGWLSTLDAMDVARHERWIAERQIKQA